MTGSVLVIGGGQSAEHDVSLETAAAIGSALRILGFAVRTITIGRDGRWSDVEGPLGECAADAVAAAIPLIARADVVFPAVHGVPGEDGTLAAPCALTQKRHCLGQAQWRTAATQDDTGE